MKKIIYIALTALLMAGCHFLDFDETSSLYDRDDMYSTYSNIQKMLTNIYGYMPYKEIADVSSALRDCGSDDNKQLILVQQLRLKKNNQQLILIQQLKLKKNNQQLILVQQLKLKKSNSQ